MSYKEYYTPHGVRMVDKLKETLATCEKEGIKQPYGTASYIEIRRSGQVYVGLVQACSASLRRTSPKHLLYVVRRAYQLENKHLGLAKEVVDRYYHWLLNESPWAVCFLTKKVLYARRYGVEMDTRKNGGLVYGATIACRIWEWPSVVVAWDALVKEGVGKNFAFLLGHYMTVDQGKVVLHFSPTEHNHTAIQPSYIADCVGYLARFTKGDFLVDHSPVNAFHLPDAGDIENYRANNQFLLGKKGTEISFLTQLKEMAIKAENEGTKNLNPFAKKFSKSYGLKKLAKALAEYESRLEVKE